MNYAAQVGTCECCGQMFDANALDHDTGTCQGCTGTAMDHYDEVARLRRHLTRVTTALADLVRINEEHNDAIAKIIKRPLGWKDAYLDDARAALVEAGGA